MRQRPPFRDHGEEIAHTLAEHRRNESLAAGPDDFTCGGVVERVGHDDPLDELFRSTTPKPGCPGVRVDAAGREWYSAAWLDGRRA